MNLIKMPSFLLKIFNSIEVVYLTAWSLLFIGICASCNADRASSIEPIVHEYYQVYQERANFQKLLSFYDDDIVLEDIILGERQDGKTALATFFDWENPGFSKIGDHALVVSSQIIAGNEVVTRGYFSSFNWGGTIFEAMHFTTWLTFNENGKIVKQIDWINYPNDLLDYDKRKNANTWIRSEQQVQ